MIYWGPDGIDILTISYQLYVQLSSRKAGRIFCGGAQETHGRHVIQSHGQPLLAKQRSLSDPPAFPGHRPVIISLIKVFGLIGLGLMVRRPSMMSFFINFGPKIQRNF